MIVLLVYLCLAGLTGAAQATCTACHPTQSDFLNVHIVPHSHDDVGWLKTVDQYYYGANNSIQNAGVQYIYDSVLDELWKDPKKKFVSVEMEFFSHWWREQNKERKRRMKKVVQRGQLEFVGGGWCMNDEAAASYVDIIDQMTLGLKFLNETFGSCGIPSAVWQVDPFGHSREQASLFARMGFEFLFLGRIDYNDKSTRLAAKQMEMMWKVSDSLKDLKLFTGILYNTYSPPSTFCFDIMCGDEPIVDDPNSPMFNIDRRSKQLVAYILEQAKHYATNNVILTMGEDFHYQYAHVWYKNLDKLMKYINKVYINSKIKLFYSTPSCYGRAVKDSLSAELPSKSDDFFPYSSDPHAYWTGYFTSRPTFKGLVRQTSNLLQACKQLQSITAGPSPALFEFQRSQAIAQHHDAVTGTAKQHVNNDYVQRLDKSVRRCYELLSDSYAGLLIMQNDSLKQEHCLMLNVSQCQSTELNTSFVVTLYNPLASRQPSHTVRLPVKDRPYIVKDHQGRLVTSQLIPLAESVLRLPGRTSEATHELVFNAVDMPPLGLRSYHIHYEPGLKMRKKKMVVQLPATRDIVVSSKDSSLTFDRRTGLLKQFGDHLVGQELLYYRGMKGNNTRFEFRASGAYIFRPDGPTVPVGSVTRLVSFVDPEGLIEVHQYVAAWATVIFRLHKDQPDFVELDWIIGPIPIDDGIGKEVVSRFTSPHITDSEGLFYTDSNGREVLERRIDFQPTYQFNVTEPIAGNFYPVNSVAFIRNKSTSAAMAVLTDRAQGATSSSSGSLEFMIHRRLLHDDAFGVGEALNETAYGEGLVARGSHWLVMNDNAKVIRPLAQRKAHPPIITFVPTELSVEEWSKSFHMEVSLLSRDFPPNVHLLTLEPWDIQGRLLVRLEHIFAVGEDDVYSKSATINLKDLFVGIVIVDVVEMNLSANQVVGPLNNWNVTLEPMQIRTFIITHNIEN